LTEGCQPPEMGPLSSPGMSSYTYIVFTLLRIIIVVTVGLYLSPFSQCSGCFRRTDRVSLAIGGMR